MSAAGGSFGAVGLAVSSTAVTLASSFGGSCVVVAGVSLATTPRPRLVAVAAAVLLAGLLASAQMLYFADAYLGALFDEDVACNGGSSSCGVAFASRRYFVSANDPIALFASAGALVLTGRGRDDFVRTGCLVRSAGGVATLLSSCVAVVIVVNVLLSGLSVPAAPAFEVAIRCCAAVAAAQRERLVALAIQLCAYAPYLADDSFDAAYLTHHLLAWSGGACLLAFASSLFNTLLCRLDRGSWFNEVEWLYAASLKGFLSLELSLFLATCTSFSCYNGQVFETSPTFAVTFCSHHFVSVVTACLLLLAPWCTASRVVYFALPVLAAGVYAASAAGSAPYAVVDHECAAVTGVSAVAVFLALPYAA